MLNTDLAYKKIICIFNHTQNVKQKTTVKKENTENYKSKLF